MSERHNRGFWLVVGSIGLACVLLVAAILYNAPMKETIGHAEATLRVAQAAAVQARPGACFYIHLTDAGDVFYGVGTVCTGSVAMRATDPRW